LARAWVATPKNKRPEPPPTLIETLIEGLRPADSRRGPSVSAAARDALNRLLECNITMMWQWSVYHGTGRRERYAQRVRRAWERTVKAVRDQRRAPAEQPKDDPFHRIQRQYARHLLQKLRSDTENERIDAGRELTGMGNRGLDMLAIGMKDDDPAMAARCRALRRQMILNNAQADRDAATFDPLVADPFVPAEEPQGKPETGITSPDVPAMGAAPCRQPIASCA
jgi:hypothetical protein